MTAIPELCVVIPVLNEASNIAPLVTRLEATLANIAWEVIFVDDDSRDGTREAIRACAATDPRIRMVHRIGRRGLASAFIEGAQATLAPTIAAMDGDLQHDETLLPLMLTEIRNGADIVIGSRHVAGGGMGDFAAARVGMSNAATALSRLVLHTDVSDPMSGFFMLRRETFNAAARKLSAIGFKILLDIIASLPTPPRIVELPYTFRTRIHGESKLDAGVLLDFAVLLVDKLVGHIIPVRFLLFAGVGALGIGAHLIVLRAALALGQDFLHAQITATACAIAGNYVLNNIFTFRERRRRRWRFATGLALFAATSAVGAFANVSISNVLFGAPSGTWFLAGLAGAVMTLVWNYAISSAITWRR